MIFSYLASSIVRGLFAILALWGIDRVEQKLPLRWQKGLLVLALLLIALPQGMIWRQSSPVPEIKLPAAALVRPLTVAAPAATPAAQGLTAQIPDAAPTVMIKPPRPWPDLVLEAFLWCSGVFAAVQLGLLGLLCRRIGQMTPVTDPKLLALLAEVRETVSLKRPVRLLNAKNFISSPGCFGVIHPKIMLPQTVIDRTSLADLRLLLLHECIHLKRRHPLENLLMYALGMLLWFNPAYWVVNRKLRLLNELIADDTTLKFCPDSYRYAKLLTSTSVQSYRLLYRPVPSLNQNAKEITRRLKEIAMRTTAKNFRPLLIALPVFALLSLIPLVSWAGETMIAYQSPANFTQEDISWRTLSRQINQDMTDKKYAEALGIFVWYYNNILKYNSPQTGVRNSFCLDKWLELGKVYPPALAELQNIYNVKEKLFLDNKVALTYPGANADGTPRDWQRNPPKTQKDWELFFVQQQGDIASFGDITAINKYLNTPEKTVRLFLQVEQINPALARKAWIYVADTFLEQKDYATANRYIPDAKTEWQRTFDSFANDHMEDKLTAEQYKSYQETVKTILTHKAELLSALAQYQKQNRVAEAIQNELKEYLNK